MSSTVKRNIAVLVDVRSNKQVTPINLFVYDGLVVIQWINYTFICQIIDICGIIANIINIICFVKQGFKDSVNVSLLGLAISDIGCLTTLIWTNICMTPAFNSVDLPFHAIEFQHLTSCITHTTFSRLTAWITAFITLERCLCITSPLKVKKLVTPKRVLIVILIFFILLLSSVAPVFMVSKLGMKFFPERNKTLLGIVYRGNRQTVERVSYAINNVFIPFGSLFVISTCTLVLVVKLRNKAKWRKTATTFTQADNISNRNQKVAKMILMISTMFIICFLPYSVIFIVMAVEPELSIGGLYNDHLVIVAGFGFILDSINSSVNIFFYYNMSSKYRAVFKQLFRMSSNKAENQIECSLVKN